MPKYDSLVNAALVSSSGICHPLFYSLLELSNKILYTYPMDGSAYSSLRQIQKAFKKTLYSAKTPLSRIRGE